MRESGWTWKVGTGLMTDYYFIKPGIKRIRDGVEGKDYFVREEDAMGFANRNYGWKGGDREGGKEASGGGANKKRRNSHEEEDGEDQMRKRQKVERARQYRDLKKAQTPRGATAPPPPPPPVAAKKYDKKALWQELQSEGWKAIKAGRFNPLHDWYYVKPNCHMLDGSSELGVDFFLCEEDAIENAKKHRIEGGAKAKSPPQGRRGAATAPVGAAGLLRTPPSCRTKPQDPAIPLLSSPESLFSRSQCTDYYDWANLWPTLQRTGWRAIKAGKYNRLHDWYYVRPDRDPGHESSKLGRHYFARPEDVIEYVRRQDREGERRNRRSDENGAGRKSMGVILGAFEEEAKR